MKFEYDVVICTYNGESYIKEQLVSILEQEAYIPQRIIISDDGSSDDTLNIIDSIFKVYKFNSYSIVKGCRQGIVKNFLTALTYTSASYVFLADQDDIWFSSKVNKFAKVICLLQKKIEKNCPLLVFSDAELINAQGESLHSDFFHYQGLKPEYLSDDSILYKNCVQGASCLINRELKQIVIDSMKYVDIENLYMHDWWIALLARYYGEYYFISQPLISYRQHGRNQVGVFNKNLRFFYYIVRFRSYLKNFKQAIKQVKEFEKFTLSYQMPTKESLPPRYKRKYFYLSVIKRGIIKLLSL